MKDWIGVDLDGTLAYYHEFEGIEHIGKPVPLMVDRVKKWIKKGEEVKIFTARVYDKRTRCAAIKAIHKWLEKVGLPKLEVTHEKDPYMVELWDDRCFQVIVNTGINIQRERITDFEREILALHEQIQELRERFDLHENEDSFEKYK